MHLWRHVSEHNRSGKNKKRLDGERLHLTTDKNTPVNQTANTLFKLGATVFFQNARNLDKSNKSLVKTLGMDIWHQMRVSPKARMHEA